MAANTAAIFTLTPNIGVGALTTANTGRDGSGTIVTCFTSGANGSRVEFITLIASGTTTSGLVNLFISLDSGSTWKFWASVAVTAATPSSTVDAFKTEFVRTDGLPQIVLPATVGRVGAAPTKTETFNVICHGGDF